MPSRSLFSASAESGGFCAGPTHLCVAPWRRVRRVFWVMQPASTIMYASAVLPLLLRVAALGPVLQESGRLQEAGPLHGVEALMLRPPRGEETRIIGFSTFPTASGVEVGAAEGTLWTNSRDTGLNTERYLE